MVINPTVGGFIYPSWRWDDHLPSKIEWDLTNGPLSKLIDWILRFFRGPWNVGPVGDFLDIYNTRSLDPGTIWIFSVRWAYRQVSTLPNCIEGHDPFWESTSGVDTKQRNISFRFWFQNMLCLPLWVENEAHLTSCLLPHNPNIPGR